MASQSQPNSNASVLERVMSTYPAPLAAAAWRVQGLSSRESDVYPKCEWLMVLLETILQYTTFVLLSHHRQLLKEDKNEEDKNELPELLNKLRRPQLGHLRALQRALVHFAASDTQRNPLIASIVKYLSDTRKDPPWLAGYQELCGFMGRSNGKKTIPIGELFDQLVAYRNWRQHGSGHFIGSRELAEQVPVLETLLATILADLQCIGEYPLAYVSNISKDRDFRQIVRVQSCMGTSQRWKEKDLVVDADLAAQHCYLWGPAPEGQGIPILDLHPLLLYTRCVHEGNKEQVFMLAGQESAEVGKYRDESGHDLDPEETERIAEEMDTLLKRDRWLKHRTEQLLRQSGRQIQPHLQMLKARYGQAGYAAEYHLVRQTLGSEETFGLVPPLIDAVFIHFDVPAPEEPTLSIRSFLAEPESIQLGQSAVVRWETEGASTVAIDPAIGAVAIAGSLQVTPDATTTYTMTARSAAGRTEARELQVKVLQAPPPAVIEWFTVNPERLESGASAHLEWRTRDSQRVTIDPGVGEVGSAGQLEVKPTKSTSYELKAADHDGTVVTRTVRVEVFTPVIVPRQGWLTLEAATTLNEEIDGLMVAARSGYVFAIGRKGALACLRPTGGETWRYQHSTQVRCLYLLTDQRHIVIADWNGTLRCFEETSAIPVWETGLPGVPSCLTSGRWEGRNGVFAGTWRKGIFFCDAEGGLRQISSADSTITSICALGTAEGCLAVDAEGFVARFQPGGKSSKPLGLREPVLAVFSSATGKTGLVLTSRDQFYAVDSDLHVFWFSGASGKVTGRAAATEASAMIYATDTGRQYRIELVESGSNPSVVETAFFGNNVAPLRGVVSDRGAQYVLTHDALGGAALYTDGQLCDQVPASGIGAMAMDPFGLRIAITAGGEVRVFANQHKLERARPAKVKLSFRSPALALGRSTIAEVMLTNTGQRPAGEVHCELTGQFTDPVVLDCAQLLPGESITVSRDVVPAIGGKFTVGARVRYTDAGKSHNETFQNLGVAEVGVNA